LDRAESNQVAEAVESLAPSRLGTHQPQSFPVAETARLYSQDTAHFSPRISLRQADDPPVTNSANDYAPVVNLT
jgi:hypothetical protein